MGKTDVPPDPMARSSSVTMLPHRRKGSGPASTSESIHVGAQTSDGGAHGNIGLANAALAGRREPRNLRDTHNRPSSASRASGGERAPVDASSLAGVGVLLPSAGPSAPTASRESHPSAGASETVPSGGIRIRGHSATNLPPPGGTGGDSVASGALNFIKFEFTSIWDCSRIVPLGLRGRSSQHWKPAAEGYTISHAHPNPRIPLGGKFQDLVPEPGQGIAASSTMPVSSAMPRVNGLVDLDDLSPPR